MCCAVAIALTTCAVLAHNPQRDSPRPLFTALGIDVDLTSLLLLAAMALWGAARGGGNVVLTSLADSVPAGVARTALAK